MAEKALWGDRLKGWVQYVLELFWKVRYNFDPAFRVPYDFSAHVFQETLDREYNSLPEDVRNDPRNKARYEELKKVLPHQQSDVLDAAKTLADEAGEYMSKTYMSLTPVPISGAFAAASTLVALDAAKDISIGLAGLAAETLSLGQVDTTTDFFKFLRAKTGYGGVMTMLMKAPLEMSLLRPLSYHLHETFRNELPPLWDIADMSTKGNLEATGARSGFASGIFGIGKPSATDKDIFMSIGGYEGYEQWYLDAKWDSRWRELRLGEIAWALADSLVDDAQLDRMLGYAKYSPEDRPIIIKFIRARYLRPYRDRVASQLRNKYKEGYISAKDFRLQLAAIEIPLPVRDMLVAEADALFEIDMNADKIAAWEAQYLKNPSMTDAELRTLYSTIIVDPARIEPRIAKLRAQRTKPAALPKPATQGVKVSSKPSWSRIMLDSTDTGKLTPETIETSPGTHTLTVYAADYEPYSEEFEIAAGEFAEMYAVLVPLPSAAEA